MHLTLDYTTLDWEVCTAEKRHDYRVQADKIETVSFMLPFVNNSLSAWSRVLRRT